MTTFSDTIAIRPADAIPGPTTGERPTVNDAEAAQSRAIDQFIERFAAVAGRHLNTEAWLFTCPSGDWTQGAANRFVGDGKVIVTHVGRSGRWCVDLIEGGRCRLFAGDVQDHDLAGVVSRAIRRLTPAE